jgi:hypothetical protein
LNFWFKEAQKKLITDQMKAILAARLSVAQDKDYQMMMAEYDRQLRELALGKDSVVASNWDDLKLMKRRK